MKTRYLITIIIGLIIIVFGVLSVQENARYNEQQAIKEEIKQEKLVAEQKKCDQMLLGLQKQWSNIIGIEYIGIPDVMGECFVTYVDPDTEEVATGGLSTMKTSTK